MPDDDLTRAQWRKTRYSGNSGNCVEVAILDNGVAVRDSKDPDGPVLMLTHGSWRTFLRGMKRRGGYPVLR
jgi:hypothetical protein